MDPVSRLSKARAALQKAAGAKSAASNEATAHASGSQPRKAGPDLRAEIARRVAQIDPSQPDQRAAALRVFLEQVLTREFGHAAVASAAFQQRIADVQRVMDGDKTTRSEVDELLKSLARK